MDAGASGTGYPTKPKHRHYPHGDKQGGKPRDRYTPPIGRGQYRQSPVTKVGSQALPGHKLFSHAQGASPFTPMQQRVVEARPCFDKLVAQDTFDELNSKSTRFGQRYDGRDHRHYAINMKKYTAMGEQPLNPEEQNQLIPLLKPFKPMASWSWRSLTTIFHAFTVAGVFTPQKSTDQTVKNQQQALLTAYLNAARQKCGQDSGNSDIDTQGVANLLWSMARLVSYGVELTPELKAAATALLPHVNEQLANFNAQEIANLLWAITKLVDHGLEWTSESNDTPDPKETLIALLACAPGHKADFKPLEMANLLWSLGKLADDGLELTTEIKEIIIELLPHVIKLSPRLSLHEIDTLLWSLAKLADNGLSLTTEGKGTRDPEEVAAILLFFAHKQNAQLNPQKMVYLPWSTAKLASLGLELTADIKEMMATLLPLTGQQKSHCKPQEAVTLLWTIGVLVEKGLPLSAELKTTVTHLLPFVEEHKELFKAGDVSSLIGSMARLVNHRQQPITQFDKTLIRTITTLFPLVKSQKEYFKAHHINSLMLAIGKLVHKGLKPTAELTAAIDILLPLIEAQKANCSTHYIVNLMWSMVILADNRLELAPAFKESATALLLHAKEQKDQFTDHDLTNLIWATARLGELIDTNVVATVSAALVGNINEPEKLDLPDLFRTLWGLLSCRARLYLDGETGGSDKLQASIAQLFTLTHNVPISNEEDKSVILLAASWLGAPCPVHFSYQTNASWSQNHFFKQLVARIPSLKVETEKKIGLLPPVDLCLPEYRVAIEIQGPYHYVGSGFQIRNGSTLLKTALLKKRGYEVIEIPVNQIETVKSAQVCIDQITQKIPGMSMGYATHSPMGLEEESSDKEYFTATSDSGPDSDSEPDSGSAYLSAPEDLSPVKKPVRSTAQAQDLEETEHKTKKRKRRKKKKPEFN